MSEKVVGRKVELDHRSFFGTAGKGKERGSWSWSWSVMVMQANHHSIRDRTVSSAQGMPRGNAQRGRDPSDQSVRSRLVLYAYRQLVGSTVRTGLGVGSKGR